jgi:hypothetical protein
MVWDSASAWSRSPLASFVASGLTAVRKGSAGERRDKEWIGQLRGEIGHQSVISIIASWGNAHERGRSFEPILQIVSVLKEALEDSTRLRQTAIMMPLIEN